MKKSEINILVVDDDSSFRNSMVESIKRFGFKCMGVARSEEAINSVKIKQYHAALIDCMLPKMNGMDLSRALRATRFGSCPIILMSGIFRDKGFAAEAIEKTGAVGFLSKPFHLEDLKAKLDELFKEFVTGGGVPLHVLVSKPFSTPRERTKVIEGLEEVKGFDLPFVISVLLDVGASGHLNLANTSGEIYGVTIAEGKITGVDSSETDATLTMMLLEKGFLTRQDLQMVQTKGKRGDLVALLVEQQCISPHVLPIVKKEQVLFDLRNLFTNEPMNINFVPDRSKKSGEVGWDMNDITPLLHDVVDTQITHEYLKGFYKEWMEYPIKLGPVFKFDHELFDMPLFKRLPRLGELLSGNLTIGELHAQGNYKEEDLFKSLHLMAFRRLIIFDDVKKAKGTVEYGDRMKTMLKELHGRNPLEVFSYFGLIDTPKAQDVERVYKEFARSNHPDLLSPGASTDIRQTVNQVFSIVSEAHNVLTHSEKRMKLLDDLKQKQAEDQIRAEGLAEEAINFLRRGRAGEALEKTEEAMKLYPSRSVKLAHVWGLLKSSDTDGKKAGQANKILDSISHEERRIPQYLFVQGLLRKALGDDAGAIAAFDKAIGMDANFLEARREKSVVSGKADKKVDIFNADLTQLVGNFFKKKS